MSQNAEFNIPAAFGAGAPAVPPVAAEPESPEARIARLRAKAEAQAAAEFNEDAVYAQLLADARAKQTAKLTADKGVEFPTDTQGFPEDYDVINVFLGHDKQDTAYVPVGINGFVIKVPRGEDVIIPHCFVEVLDHAVKGETIQSGRGLIVRNSHRFPYMFKRKATKAEYQAYQVTQRERAQRELAQAA